MFVVGGVVCAVVVVGFSWSMLFLSEVLLLLSMFRVAFAVGVVFVVVIVVLSRPCCCWCSLLSWL